ERYRPPRSGAVIRSSFGTARSGRCTNKDGGAHPRSVRKIVLVHPEVMADLVQDRPPHLLHQLAVTPAGLLMRVFVQGDALRQTLTCPERARSFVEPHQAIARPLFEDEHGVLEIGLELFGNRVDRDRKSTRLNQSLAYL